MKCKPWIRHFQPRKLQCFRSQFALHGLRNLELRTTARESTSPSQFPLPWISDNGWGYVSQIGWGSSACLKSCAMMYDEGPIPGWAKDLDGEQHATNRKGKQNYGMRLNVEVSDLEVRMWRYGRTNFCRGWGFRDFLLVFVFEDPAFHVSNVITSMPQTSPTQHIWHSNRSTVGRKIKGQHD